MTTEQHERIEPRAHVFLAATLCDASGSTSVRIRNLSAHGALMDGPELPAPGSSVRLVRVALVASGRIAWNRRGQAGVSFDNEVDVDAWVKASGNTDQQRVEKLVRAIRQERESREVGVRPMPSLPAISAELDEICERLARLPNARAELGDEVVKLDMIAQSLRLLAGAAVE